MINRKNLTIFDFFFQKWKINVKIREKNINCFETQFPEDFDDSVIFD